MNKLYLLLLLSAASPLCAMDDDGFGVTALGGFAGAFGASAEVVAPTNELSAAVASLLVARPSEIGGAIGDWVASEAARAVEEADVSEADQGPSGLLHAADSADVVTGIVEVDDQNEALRGLRFFSTERLLKSRAKDDNALPVRTEVSRERDDFGLHYPDAPGTAHFANLVDPKINLSMPVNSNRRLKAVYVLPVAGFVAMVTAATAWARHHVKTRRAMQEPTIFDRASEKAKKFVQSCKRFALARRSH